MLIMINFFALYTFYDRSLHYFYKEENNQIVVRENIDNEWKLNKLINFFNDPVHIIDNIYLGNAYNAANYNNLKDLKIKIIINVTKEIQNYYPEDFHYYNIKIMDTNNEIFNDEFNNVLNYLKNTKINESENILVHCYMGCSRSVAVILSYIIKEKKLELSDAIKYIKNKKNT